MVEGPRPRFNDEGPDFGDPEHYSDVDPYGADYDGFGSMDRDELFDSRHPGEANRIQEEVGRIHIDPTNQNQDIRKDGGRIVS